MPATVVGKEAGSGRGLGTVEGGRGRGRVRLGSGTAEGYRLSLRSTGAAKGGRRRMGSRVEGWLIWGRDLGE